MFVLFGQLFAAIKMAALIYTSCTSGFPSLWKQEWTRQQQ